MTKRQRIAFRILFFLYIAAVLLLCFGRFDHAPSVKPSFLGIPTDKLVHFIMFFPFPILAFLAFDQFTDNLKSSLLFTGATFLVGILLALGTEWGQAHLTHYRSGDGWDLLADTIALTISSSLVLIRDIYKMKR